MFLKRFPRRFCQPGLSKYTACFYVRQVMEGVNGRAADDRPMKTSEADVPGSDRGAYATLRPNPNELSSRSPSSWSIPSDGVDLYGDRPGDARPATGLQNGERMTAEKGGKCCGVQPCSVEDAVLSTGVEKNLPPCADSGGKRNGNGTPRGDISISSPYTDTQECSVLKGPVGNGDALLGPPVAEAVQRSSNAQMSGAAPNGISVVEPGGMSQALVSGDIMERPGASAVWVAGRDQAHYVGQEEAHSSPKAATAKGDVAEERESVLAAGNSAPLSPTQPRRPLASPESKRVQSGVADRAPTDSASRTSEEASVPRAETSGNGTVASARTGARSYSSHSSAIAPGSDFQDGTACQSLPRDSVWGSTEHLAPMSGHQTRGAEDEHPERTPWGEPIEHECLGDTTDIALAALSYANAVAEGGVVGSLTSGTAAGPESGGTRGKSPPASMPRAGTSSMLTAVESNGTAGPSEEQGGDRVVSTDVTAASATTQPDSRASSNGRVPPKATEVSKATVPPSDTTRALSSNGVRRTTRGQKGSRASDHHEDMMHAICMICLEKLSDASGKGRAKILGVLDSCSHRYCYTVSHAALVKVDRKRCIVTPRRKKVPRGKHMQLLRLVGKG